MSKGLNLKMINSQLNAYGYKIARKCEDDGTQPTAAVPQEEVKTLFPRQGERPEIKINFAKKPPGTVGRGKFQLERIIGISDDDKKFCTKVLRTFLYLDPDIDMSKAKGNNPPGPILRVIIKSVGVLGEFKIFEKERYWPLEALVLAILKGSSQTAKGYAARSRAMKREREAARQAQGITTGSPVKQTGSMIGRPRKTKAPAIAEGPPSNNNSNMEVDNGVTREAVASKETLAGENGESEGKGGHTDFGDAMDLSFKGPASPNGLGAVEDDDEVLAYELSSMNLDPIQGSKPDEPSSPSTGPILPLDISTGPFLPLDISTPAISHSRSHPVNPSAPPRRQLSKAPTVASDRRSLGNPEQSSRSMPRTIVSLHERLPTTPPGPTTVHTLSSKPASVAATADTLVSTTSTLQEPNNTTPSTPQALMGMTPNLLAQLALLPVSTLATFSPELQAAVAASKASVTASALNPTPTSTSPSVPAPDLAKRPTIAKATAKATPVEATAKAAPANASTEHPSNYAPFDDDGYLSDAPSASASNPPVDSKSEQAPVVEPSSKQQHANATAPEYLEEGSAPKPRGKQGAVKEVDLAGANEKGKKGSKGPGTGAKRGGGRKGARAGIDTLASEEPPVPQGTVGASVDEPTTVGKQPPKRATRSTNGAKKAAAGK